MSYRCADRGLNDRLGERKRIDARRMTVLFEVALEHARVFDHDLLRVARVQRIHLNVSFSSFAGQHAKI